MKAILVDSDILIEVSRGRDAEVLERWDELSREDAAVFCSPVTLAEVWQGARPKEHALLTALFAVLTCVPIDAEIGRLAGDYLGKYAKSHALELGDALIAATASVHQLNLWTRNRKHYPMQSIGFW
ncbi:MAG: type II toxin-antitoxin system VapC family toxin [Bryobacteraceae bacterium]